MLISSTDNKRIKEARKLLEKKYSLEKGLFLIEGDHAVKEALKKNLITELYLLEGNNDSYDFDYDIVTLKVMKTLSNIKSTPRVIGIAKINNDCTIGKRIVILDDIQDPGNAGTIVRSSVAFGIDTIIFSKNSVSPYNPKVIRSTEGMIFNVNIIVSDLESIIKEIQSKCINVIGTSLNTNNSLKNITKIDSYAVVFGNEGNGISDKILNLCDFVYKIDMEDDCESLNVGVSCGIILYKLYEANNGIH